MLAQDTHTGALYEVPEHLAGPYGEPHYDGLGFPGLGNLFKSVVGALPGIGNIVGGLFGGGGGGAAPVPAVPQIPGLSSLMSMLGGGGGGLPGIPGLSNILGMLGGGGGGGLSGYGGPSVGLGFPGLLPFQFPGILSRLMGGGGFPAPPRPAFPFMQRPPGWIPRPTPYTGMPPRRMYMRCAVWPSPPGLVPAWAAQAQAPAPGAVPLPGQVPGLPGTPGGGGRHRRGRLRRRR
jgi:hypothetical protein